MLLSEALAARKQALTDIRDLGSRWKAASVAYEDDTANEDAESLGNAFSDAVKTLRDMTVRINKTNNETRVVFDGESMSIMEAVALRESLLLSAKTLRAVADHATTTVAGRSRYGAQRTKDDIREVAQIDIGATRSEADSMSEEIRRLDSALQQKNWTTNLLDG